MKPKKALTFIVVGNDTSVDEMVRKRGHIPATVSLLPNPNHYDGVIFTGGADINPYLYGQGLHAQTKPDYARDLRELAILRRIPLGMPKLGICRGGQLLNVYSGGSMWQHVDNHLSSHKAMDLMTGTEFHCPSVHHQAMRPTKDAWLLITAAESTKYQDFHTSKDIPNNKDEDVEACYYAHTNSYCFQGHPEYPGYKEATTIFWEHCDMVFEDVWYPKEKEKVA